MKNIYNRNSKCCGFASTSLGYCKHIFALQNIGNSLKLNISRLFKSFFC